MIALSIVVAVKDATGNLDAVLTRLRKHGKSVEVIFAVAGSIPATLSRVSGDWKVLGAPAGTLVPHLWADGIKAAAGARVALTTAQCIPAVDWVTRLIAMDQAETVAVGGALENDPAASALNWAIYFLRYSAYMPGGNAGPRLEIAADNAVYNRAAILRNGDLLEAGFWEPSFHERFRANGDTLLFDPGLVVEHHGRVAAAEFAAQRFAHGREYGRARIEGAPLVCRIALLAASAAVPLILYVRICNRIIREGSYREKLFRATPWLTVLILAWTLGEAAGYAAMPKSFPRDSGTAANKTGIPHE